MNIYGAMIAVMRDVGAIAKDRKNATQGYSFRGIDDVYAALHDLLAKHGVFTIPEVISDRSEERTTKSGSALIYRILKIRYTFCAEDGSCLASTVIGEGMDSGDKASNKAMSVAHKYALLQVFCIPTEDAKDPEMDSPEVIPKPEPVKKDQVWETWKADQYPSIRDGFGEAGRVLQWTQNKMDEMSTIVKEMLKSHDIAGIKALSLDVAIQVEAQRDVEKAAKSEPIQAEIF
jgi:hypothetical protein